MNINYEGLVCYLNSNKDSKQNNVWLDSSGNNNNATLTSFSDNDFNGSYVQFNGNNYAVIPRCIQDDFTLSAEVILESSTSTAGPSQLWYNYASLIDAETSGVNNDFGLTISKDGHAYFGIGNPDRTIPYAQKSLFNEKHIITCTRKKDTGEYAMYIDGILIKKEIHPNKNSLTYPSEIYVGKGINNRFLSMKLFSIRIYNRVLDNFEIKQDSFFVKNKVYVNENNLPIIVDKLTDAKNIKISNNKYGNRIQTVVDKIVEKADEVTKAIKQEVVNDSYSFKVGTGNVDVSADVEDGFGEVGIKGVTYQNLYPQLNTKNYYDKYGAVQFDRDIIKFTANGSYQNIFLKKEALIVKPNTTYTLIIDILKNTIVNEQDDSMLLFLETYKESNQLSYFNEMIRLNKNDDIGRYKFIVTTKSDFSISSYATRCFLNNKATSGELWIKYCILEGDHTNNPNLPSYFEGIVGVGDKSKNLFNPNNSAFVEKQGDKYVATVSNASLNYDTLSLKPNTKYTVSAKFEKWLQLNIDGVVIASGSAINGVKWTFTTNNTGVTKFYFGANSPSDIGCSFIEPIQLEEGSTATPYEPYYDGHKIEILSNGKNLWNGKMYSGWGGASPTMDELGCRDNVITDFIRVARNKNCFINKAGFAYAWLYDLNKNLIDAYHGNINAFDNGVATKNADYIILGRSLGSSQINKEEYMDTIISYNKNDSFIESKSDKTQILLDEPLMRLPNGIHDEITRDGKLIRRVGKIVFDGTENWSPYNIDGNTTHFAISIPYIDKFNGGLISHIENNNNKFMCDKALVTQTRKANLTSICSFYYGPENRYFMFNLPCSSLESAKNWLIENKPILYFPLPTPTIIELPAPCLRIFKDGHITFNTLVAPESNHVVQLNKSAQIQNAIKESQSLDNRINVLENNYDNLILFTMSRLNDLELNYTLK